MKGENLKDKLLPYIHYIILAVGILIFIVAFLIHPHKKNYLKTPPNSHGIPKTKNNKPMTPANMPVTPEKLPPLPPTSMNSTNKGKNTNNTQTLAENSSDASESASDISAPAASSTQQKQENKAQNNQSTSKKNTNVKHVEEHPSYHSSYQKHYHEHHQKHYHEHHYEQPKQYRRVESSNNSRARYAAVICSYNKCNLYVDNKKYKEGSKIGKYRIKGLSVDKIILQNPKDLLKLINLKNNN